MNRHRESLPESSLPLRRRLGSFLARSFVVLLISLVLLEIAGRVGLALWPLIHRAAVTDMVSGNPAYVSLPWAADCMKEQKLRERDTYFPFRLWGVTESHGNCINNDATDLGIVRRTINPPNPACTSNPRLRVWVFGGSAAYGTLIPDWATLPSQLSRILNTSSRCVEISNLGVEGYVTNQELLLLIEQLKAGRRPDVVILYDGFNDADAGTSLPGPVAHLRYTTMRHRMEGGLSTKVDILPHLAIWRFAQALSGPRGRKGLPRVPDTQLPDRGNQTLNNYLQNLKIIRMLGETYRFKVCAFWQPSLIYGHKPLVPYERQFLELSTTEAFPFAALAPVYREAAQRSQHEGQFVFLGDIFDDSSQPLYLDWVHLNPEGNQLVAQVMARQLDSCLQ
jgi:lysophospholipase L1-like esterase